jgi:hypothetical protein
LKSWANELLFIITLDNSSIYDYFEINFDSIIINTKGITIPFMSTNKDNVDNVRNVTLSSNQYFIARGQYIIYEFMIKTKILYYASTFSGLLGFKADNNSTNIEIEEKVLASIPNASYTVLELRFNPDEYLIYQEDKYQTTGNIKIKYIYIFLINLKPIFSFFFFFS